MIDATEKINEFVAITMLSAMSYKTHEDLYIFMEIDDDYQFDICHENIMDLFPEDKEKLFKEWNQIANEIFLHKRMELINLLTEK